MMPALSAPTREPAAPRCRRRSTCLVLLCVLLLTSCKFEGMNSYVLPGTVGTGQDAYTVHVEIRDVGNLTRNAEVKVGNVAVGTVTGMKARDWHAVVTVGLKPSVTLPANATAAVGQNSLLGASYLELASPKHRKPAGKLTNGDTIPLRRTDSYPSTEEVFASASVVLNGSGLGQLETITRELRRALGGENRAVAKLLPTLHEFTSRLDRQRDEIVRAMESLNGLAGKLANENALIADAIERVTPALKVLRRERADLTATLSTLDKLGKTANRVIDASKKNLVANLRDLRPALRELADSGRDLVKALNIAGTFPFPASNVPRACKGDYCNLFARLDLTLQSLDASMLSGTPLQGTLMGLQRLLGERAGVAADATNPLRGPVAGPAAAGGDGGDGAGARQKGQVPLADTLDSLLGGGQ